MNEEELTASEIIAANPEIQEEIDTISGKAVNDAFEAWQGEQEKSETVPETPEPKPAPAPAQPLKQEAKYATPVAVTVDDIEKLIPQAAGPAVVSNNIVDYVRLSAIIYKNMLARKSLSVHHLQRRLNELGYTEAFADRDGFYGDKTKEAIGRFQGDNNLPGGGTANRETLELLFTGDPNVNLID